MLRRRGDFNWLCRLILIQRGEPYMWQFDCLCLELIGSSLCLANDSVFVQFLQHPKTFQMPIAAGASAASRTSASTSPTRSGRSPTWRSIVRPFKPVSCRSRRMNFSSCWRSWFDESQNDFGLVTEAFLSNQRKAETNETLYKLPNLKFLCEGAKETFS